MIFHRAPQGSQDWLDARVGVITASRFKDARDKLKNDAPSKASLAYAFDVARERAGGSAPAVFQNAAMRLGTEQEPVARARYEADTGKLVHEVGFAKTEDGKFGVSVDGLIGDDGVWECKTMVSSATMFDAVVDGNLGEYMDQCNGAMWLLGRKWVDLSLWVPDLDLLKTIRIARDDDVIEKLEADMMAFERRVSLLHTSLARLLAKD